MTKTDLHIRLGKYDSDIKDHLAKVQETEPISQYVKKAIREKAKNDKKNN